MRARSTLPRSAVDCGARALSPFGALVQGRAFSGLRDSLFAKAFEALPFAAFDSLLPPNIPHQKKYYGQSESGDADESGLHRGAALARNVQIRRARQFNLG